MYNKENIIPKIELTKDYKISRILKGGWQLAGGHGYIDRKQAIEDMFKFANAGITTFDFGDIYTGVEELVGQFLKEYTNKFGRERIHDVQLNTKFVPDLDILSAISKQYVEGVIDRSLRRLGVESLDLVQFHWWDYDVPRYIETAHYLVDLQEKGKIKHIGVTNFDVPRLKELIESEVNIISNQVQYSVLDHRPKNGMIKLCQKYNIKLLCYGTAAGGFLSERYLNVKEPKPPYENRSLTKYRLIIDDFGGWGLFQELLSVLDKIAKKHNVSITNVASKYILSKEQAAGIIIGARNACHLDDNLKVFNFELDVRDKSLIKEVIDKSICPQGDIYALERIKGGKHAGIMKYNLNKGNNYK